MNGYNPFSLQGKRVLITGSSSGIGQATAVECSKMGAILWIAGRDTKRLQQTKSLLEGVGHESFIGDLTDNEILQDLVARIDMLDGLVLSAGLGLTLPFLFSDRETFNRIFEINFFSQIELLRMLIKKKKLAKNSSVVIVSSIGGILQFDIGNSIYSASKAALNAMLKIVALEVAPKGIRINSVNPGMVDTNLIHAGTLTEEQLAEDAKKYPLKRYGKPEEIGYAVIYLLSEASSWITGTNLVIDGGNSI